MFSSNKLISFVFANENDIYYGDDLLKLNLEQYLWEQLHRSYDAVYYLNANGNLFQVCTFGDLNCSTYKPGKKNLFVKNSEQTEQGEWILKQLRAKSGKTAAFVCSLEDFCGVLSDVRWKKVLEEIAEEKNRTGIFVLTASATAEKTTELLLESPVFAALQEKDVTDLRGGELRALYSALKKRKWNNCQFLNSFSWERVRAVLLHLSMEYPDRCESCQQLECLTDYLCAYLRDPEMQQTQRLFHDSMPAEYMLYRELYEQLANQRNWDRLVQQSCCYNNTGQDVRTQTDFVPVIRERNCYAGRCLRIRLPEWVRNHEDGPRIAQLLQEIRMAVSKPLNRMENTQVAGAAEAFLDQLETVQREDLNSYKQLLMILNFCIKWVYTEPDSKEMTQLLKAIDTMKSAMSASFQYFSMKREHEWNRQNLGNSTLEVMAFHKRGELVEQWKMTSEKYADIVSALIMEMTGPDVSEGITDTLEKLQEETRLMEEQLQKSDGEEEKLPDNEPDPTPEPSERDLSDEAEEEINFDDPTLRGYMPTVNY